MPHLWLRLWFVCGALFAALPARAQGYSPPAIAGHVTDAAGKLSPPETAKLEAKLADYRRCSSNHVAVFVARSLEGHPIEDVAYATFNRWKVGEAGKDNGVLLVIAPAERKVRIETGKGVGGELTDLQASEIVRQRISPRLAAG
ncbi:MAG TPA: TPM domain-containing protein, partial [Polyangiaceae bacterium]|nr:TPM domain-containing protein [Polyangiaceae bacterium]